MTDRHVTYLIVKAVERNGGRWIEGYATTPTQDRVGDVVLPEGAQFNLPIPLLFAHKHEEPIGSVVEANVTRAGIRIRAKLTQGVSRAEEVWKLILDGALTAVSIGFQALKSTPLASGGVRFDSWSWHELSVVSVPANPDARISVGKSLCYANQTAMPTVPKATELRSSQTFTMSDIDMLEYSKEMGAIIRDAIKPLKDRIAVLERDIADRGIRFRGYWRDGLAVKKGDATTNDGSLWIAVRDTDETPSAASPDWCLAARKGRDGK